MEPLEIFLIVIIILLIVLLAIFAFRRNEKKQEGVSHTEPVEEMLRSNNQSIKEEMTEMLNHQNVSQQQQIAKMQSDILLQVQKSMSLFNENVHSNFQSLDGKVDQFLKNSMDQTKDSVSYLERSLTEIQMTQKNMQQLQKEMSSIGTILTNSQARGRYGEMQLELLLKDVFGETKGKYYDYQYTLKATGFNGNALRPDAVIFLNQGEKRTVLAIDSKFSIVGFEGLFDGALSLSSTEGKEAMSQLKTALKKRIDETSKYIIDGETLEESIMFVPGDSIYAFIAGSLPDVAEYARRKRVLLTSPTILPPLLASLKSILLQSEKNDNAQKIVEELSALNVEFQRFQQRWDTLQKNIMATEKSAEDLSITVRKIHRRFEQIANLQLEDEESKSE